MKKIFILTSILISINLKIQAQQTSIFSNFYVNPFLCNPANAGLRGSNLFLLNRMQYMGVKGKPETYCGTLDGLLNNGKIGYGLTFFNDLVNIIGKTGASGTYSYKLKTGLNQSLSFGLALGFEQNSIKLDRVNSETPYEITLINNTQNTSNFDANFGITYNLKDLTFGIAGYQLLGNDNILLNDQNRDEFTYNFHRHYLASALYSVPLKKDVIFFDPSLQVRFAKDVKPQIDINALANYKKKFWAGVGYRQQYGLDYMIGGLLANKITIGYAYGMSTGALKKLATSNHEFILGFKLNGKNQDSDKDKDGVLDQFDRELETPLGCNVDKNGIAIDSDQDKYPDCKDKEINSPFGAPVDSVGIALDTDKDGVIDMYDREPDTEYPCKVDKAGVAIDTDKDAVPDCRDKELKSPYGSPVDEDGVALDIDKDKVPDVFDFEPETPHWQHVHATTPYLDASPCIVDKRGIAKDSDLDGVPDCVDKELFSPKGSKVDKNGVSDGKPIADKEPISKNDVDGDGVADDLDLEPNTPKGNKVDEWGRSPIVQNDPASLHRIEIEQVEDNSTEWDYYVIVGVFKYYNNLKNYQKYLLKTYNENTKVIVTEQNFYYVWTKQIYTQDEARTEVNRLKGKNVEDYIVGNPWLWREPKKK